MQCKAGAQLEPLLKISVSPTELPVLLIQMLIFYTLLFHETHQAPGPDLSCRPRI
jgi:hypothetical protein